MLLSAQLREALSLVILNGSSLEYKYGSLTLVTLQYPVTRYLKKMWAVV